MKKIFKKRYSLVDVVVVGAAALLMGDGYYESAVLLVLIGAFLIVCFRPIEYKSS